LKFLSPPFTEELKGVLRRDLSAFQDCADTASHVQSRIRINMKQADERRRRMSEAEENGRVEEDLADGMQIVRRYEGETTAEALVLNLIRAHQQRT